MEITSLSIGFAFGAGIVGFLAQFIFVTKGELKNSEQKQSDALIAHEKEERDRNEVSFHRLDDKMDRVDKAISDLRVELANKYSRYRRTDDDSKGA